MGLIKNPYYDEIQPNRCRPDNPGLTGWPPPPWYSAEQYVQFPRLRNGRLDIEALDKVGVRNQMVRKYAWAIPDERSIVTVAGYVQGDRLVEVGAGTGYWAYLLRQIGVDVVAIDQVWSEGQSQTGADRWINILDVQPGETNFQPILAQAGNAPFLLLCWPTYDDPFAMNVLRVFQGHTLFYIGEGSGGCTANDEFHEALDNHWVEVQDIALPQWEGIHDRLYIYQRKNASGQPVAAARIANRKVRGFEAFNGLS